MRLILDRLPRLLLPLGLAFIVGSHRACTAAAQDPAETALVIEHVRTNASLTFRNSSGVLSFPFQVPSGVYNTLWDWDSVFEGVATLPYGSSPFFTGSMSNYLSNVTVPSGEVPGGLSPTGSTGVLYHAKPVLIWGAYLAAKASGNWSYWSQFEDQMDALLTYWNNTNRFEPSTGLFYWHDQLESGCDNLVLSQCPSAFSSCWNEAEDAYTLASPDLQVFIYREYKAAALFKQQWASEAVRRGDGGAEAEALVVRAQQATQRFTAVGAIIRSALNDRLWFQLSPGVGWWAAWNRSQHAQIRARTHQMALPLWEDLAANQSQVADAVAAVLAPDMLSDWGINSCSSVDSRYSNINEINPYSNWRGPIWINTNTILAVTLARLGYAAEAKRIADSLVHVLASDLRETGTWHECYSSEDGSSLAAPGFLSWR